MDGSTHIDTALRGYVDRIVNLHQDRDAVNGDIREVYGELKDAGFNVTIVRGMVKEQRMEPEARDSLYQLQNEYRIKLGLFADTPLGEAAIRREAEPTFATGQQLDEAEIEVARTRWNEATAGHAVERPTPFAEQPVHTRRPRGRPRKSPAEARQHLGGSKPMFDA